MRALELIGGAEFPAKVAASRVLVIGAGGIGTELIKNLVMGGFTGGIDVIDLDTIDISNLNRQFLFRKHHVGKSKAEIACQVARQFNPAASLRAYQGNVIDEQFGPSFVSQFAVIFSALDNVKARRHVNRLALATGVPLIESGTMGFQGQVQLIMGGKTACYECSPTQTPRSFPVCTIRHSPSAPIHCIVWAKDYLFVELFGPADALVNLDADADAARTEGDAADADADAADELPAARRLDRSSDPTAVFDEVFCNDVREVAGIDKLWKGRKPPTPIAFADVTPAAPPADAGNRAWTTHECAHVFLASCAALRARIVAMRADAAADADVSLAWDKDDPEALAFVTAAANLRAYAFDIEPKSEFDVKAMAGNIIPAIASTNAIAAGAQVVMAYQILAGRTDECRMTYILRLVSGNRVLLSVDNEPPNSACFVCQKHTVTVRTNTATCTLGRLCTEILAAKLGFDAPRVVVDEDIVYEPPDEEEGSSMEAQLVKTLDAVRVRHNAMVTVEDDLTDISVNIAIVHDENESGIVLTGDAPTAPTGKRQADDAAKPADDAKRPAVAADDDDEIVILDDDDDGDGDDAAKAAAAPVAQKSDAAAGTTGDDAVMIE